MVIRLARGNIFQDSKNVVHILMIQRHILMIITIKYNKTDKCENVILCNIINLPAYLTRCFVLLYILYLMQVLL